MIALGATFVLEGWPLEVGVAALVAAVTIGAWAALTVSQPRFLVIRTPLRRIPAMRRALDDSRAVALAARINAVMLSVLAFVSAAVGLVIIVGAA